MTVGFGITPNLLTLIKDEALAGLQKELLTAGGELRPALRTMQPPLATKLSYYTTHLRTILKVKRCTLCLKPDTDAHAANGCYPP